MRYLKFLSIPLSILFILLMCGGCVPEPTETGTTPPTSGAMTVDWNMQPT